MLAGTWSGDCYNMVSRRRYVNGRNAAPVTQWQDSPTSISAPDGSPARLTPHPSPASVLAAEIKALVEAGERDQARERFGALVALLQRRAVRIAFQYLRDAADADEAVQDAFVKVFLHIDQYRSDLPFDVWFTRILVNAALDRLKARGRQQRWISHSTDEDDGRPVEKHAGRRAVARAAPAGEGTVGAGDPGRRRPARPSAAGVHALPSGRADAGGNQRGDRHEPGHRARAFVPGVAKVTGSVGRSGMSRRDISEQNGRRRTRGVSGRCVRGGRCAFRRARARRAAAQNPGAPRPPRTARQGHPVPESAAGRLPIGRVNRRWISVAAAARL